MPSLVVYDIYGGLVRQWNLQAIQLKKYHLVVPEGAKIIAVNQSTQVDRMSYELVASMTVAITFKRPEVRTWLDTRARLE